MTKDQDRLERIADLILNSKSPHLHQQTNAHCLKCAVIEKEMIRVGCLPFCYSCFEEEFSSDDPVRKENTLYREWLTKSTKGD